MTEEQLEKLTTKRLLAYHKAHRKRMLKNGYSFVIIDEDKELAKIAIRATKLNEELEQY